MKKIMHFAIIFVNLFLPYMSISQPLGIQKIGSFLFNGQEVAISQHVPSAHAFVEVSDVKLAKRNILDMNLPAIDKLPGISKDVKLPFINGQGVSITRPNPKSPSIYLPNIPFAKRNIPDMNLPAIDKLPGISKDVKLPFINGQGVSITRPNPKSPSIYLPNIPFVKRNIPGINLPGIDKLPGVPKDMKLPFINGQGLSITRPDPKYPSVSLPDVKLTKRSAQATEPFQLDNQNARPVVGRHLIGDSWEWTVSAANDMTKETKSKARQAWKYTGGILEDMGKIFD